MNTIPDLARLLETVICAATDAGALLVAERARVGGPRGGGETAPVDVEIERQLRKTLLAAWPARFVGEELGVVPCAADASQEQQRDCWVVDPQDGTRDFLRGLGGSSVSVALLREGRPVLGVVYAPMPPDRGPDLIAWAEGTGPIRRNGLVIGSREPPLARQQLTSTQRVLMSRSAEHRPEAIAALITPAQCMTMTSIAYRLALVAAGEAVATLTLHGVQSWDIAAGHALLIGAGGELYDDDGLPVRYGAEGAAEVRACFGGAPAAALELASRKSAWVKANGP